MHSFCYRYPAFFAGLFTYLGVLSGLCFFQAFLFSAPLFYAVYVYRKALLLPGSLLFGAAFFGTAYFYTLPPEGSFTGRSSFILNDFKENGRSLTYRGSVISFLENGKEIAKNVPTLVQRRRKEPLPLGKVLEGEAVLHSFDGRRTLLTPLSPQPLAEELAPSLRQELKTALKSRIEAVEEDDRVREFLTGLATGSYHHKELTQELNRFGLQHIMAISGFHFALIALFISWGLRFFINPLHARPLTMAFLTGYFTFLGWSPSIFRAWVMAVVFLSSALFYRRSRALNALGVAAVFGLLFDPLAALNLGFLFSFGITASILLFYTPFDRLLKRALPERSKEEALERPLLEKIAYLLLHWLRGLVALTCAVSLVSVPLTFAFFGTFPLQSLPMNLFFPLGTSFVMFFLIPGLLFTPLIKPAAAIAHLLLNLAYSYPLSLEFWLPLELSNSILIGLYFGALLILGIRLTNIGKKDIVLTSSWRS